MSSWTLTAAEHHIWVAHRNGVCPDCDCWLDECVCCDQIPELYATEDADE